MCWLCDHPTATPRDYLAVLRDKVRRYGWAVQYVEGERPFAYTVGLHDWNLPELLITAVSPTRARRVLNAVAREVLGRAALTSGTHLKVTDGPLVEFVEVDHPDVHLCWAVNHAEGPIRAFQVVWADGHGRWPWSPTFCDGRRRQPVLGIRAQAA